MIIFPKETLKALNSPKYLQISSNGKGILIRYSRRKLAEASIVEYPMKNNLYGIHIHDENVSKSLRNRYNWGSYLYVVDVTPFLGAFAIDPGTATKTEISNKGF